MHEFSICQGLVEVILDELDSMSGGYVKLLSARVEIGGLRQVFPDQLRTAYLILTEGTAAEGSSLDIRRIDAVGRCRSCGCESELEENFFCCPRCGSTDIELIRGRELCLTGLEIEEDE